MPFLYLVLMAALIMGQPPVPGPAQTAAPAQHELTLEEVVAATKTYFRDTAEFPMLQHTVLTATDSSGRVRKQHEGSYDYLVEGYPSGKHDVTVGTYFPSDVNILSAIGQAWNGTLNAAIANNLHAVFPVYVLFAGHAGGALTVVNRDADGVVTACLGGLQPCPPFAFSEDRLYAPRMVCGESEVQLRPDLSLQRFVFDQGSLPAAARVRPFGKTTLQSFHVEVEFQEVVISPDPVPYVVPQRVTSTLVTAKGTLTMLSDYTPNGSGALKKKLAFQPHVRAPAAAALCSKSSLSAEAA